MIVPSMTLILKWEPPSLNPVIPMTETKRRLLKWSEELKNGFPIVPLEILRKNKKRRAPQVSLNVTARTLLRQLK